MSKVYTIDEESHNLRALPNYIVTLCAIYGHTCRSAAVLEVGCEMEQRAIATQGLLGARLYIVAQTAQTVGVAPFRVEQSRASGRLPTLLKHLSVEEVRVGAKRFSGL